MPPPSQYSMCKHILEIHAYTSTVKAIYCSYHRRSYTYLYIHIHTHTTEYVSYTAMQYA